MHSSIQQRCFKANAYHYNVFKFLVYLMDLRKDIKEIGAEQKTSNSQFDDLFIILGDDTRYNIQVKDYQSCVLNAIKVYDKEITVNGTKVAYNKNENIVLIISSSLLYEDCNGSFLDLSSIRRNNLLVLPLPPILIQEKTHTLFKDKKREHCLSDFVDSKVDTNIFSIKKEDLPSVSFIEQKLKEKSYFIDLNTFKLIDNGVTHIVGPPGIGKSHYVNKIHNKYSNAVLYRFWISSDDSSYNDRITFDVFLTELGKLVFNSYRFFSEEELIKEIIANRILLIVDGLDHVENYNPNELQKYLDFFNQLNKDNAKVIIVSRPLRKKTDWTIFELHNWNIEQTCHYLEEKYHLEEYTARELFRISKGYPIIVSFLAEHYLKYHHFNINTPIENLKDYYEQIMKPLGTNSLLEVFCLNNSYLTLEDINVIFDDRFITNNIKEFISAYPYLFTCKSGRISLFHDSFYTFLRDNKYDPLLFEKQINRIKTSLRNKELRFMSRLRSFNFKDYFWDEMLIRYSNFEVFDYLISKYIDYESIQKLYFQLGDYLSKRSGLLNKYQYYDFALITMIVSRFIPTSYPDLKFLIINSLAKRNQDIKDIIFSNGIFWNLYQLASGNDYDFINYCIENYLHPTHAEQLKFELLQLVEKESIITIETDSVDIEKELYNLESNYTDATFNLIIDYFISIWENKNNSSSWYRPLETFILTGDSYYLNNSLCELLHNPTYSRRIVSSLSDYRLILDHSDFKQYESLFDCINDKAFNTKNDVSDIVLLYLKKNIACKNNIDLSSINMLWNLINNHNDYSISSINDTLLFLESKNLIREEESVSILRKITDITEKGASHLLPEYVERKGKERTKKLLKLHALDFKTAFLFNLNLDILNMIPSWFINERITELLNGITHKQQLNTHLLGNILQSSHKQTVINLIHKKGFDLKQYEIEINSENESYYPPSCNDIDLNSNDIIHSYLYRKTNEVIYYGDFCDAANNLPFIYEKQGVPIEWETILSSFKKYISYSLLLNT